MAKDRPIINNNCNNTTNNAFNLNVYLNDTCKNAMNIQDFVSSIKLNMDDLKNFATLGYIENITSIIEIISGDIKKSIMFGDSETDANAAKSASIPLILLENGYTEKNSNEIYHNHLIKDFIGVEKIVSTYFKD